MLETHTFGRYVHKASLYQHYTVIHIVCLIQICSYCIVGKYEDALSWYTG